MISSHGGIVVQLDTTVLFNSNMLIAFFMSDFWNPGFTGDSFAVSVDKNVVSELNSTVRWPGLAVVDDHALESKIGSVDGLVGSKNTGVL